MCPTKIKYVKEAVGHSTNGEHTYQMDDALAPSSFDAMFGYFGVPYLAVCFPDVHLIYRVRRCRQYRHYSDSLDDFRHFSSPQSGLKIFFVGDHLLMKMAIIFT